MTAYITPVTDRATELFYLPFRTLKAAAVFAHDAVITVAASALSILTLNFNEEIKDLANKQRSFNPLFDVYVGIRKVINPQANIETADEGHGVLTYLAKDYIWNPANEAAASDNFFKRQVVSRALFAVAGVASVVSRVTEGIFGLLAAALSIVTLGQFSKVNEFAVQNLGITKVIPDVALAARKVLFPA